MKKIIIIGGGLSGLSAAVNLIKKGFKIEILESSQKLGGRTYSLQSDNLNSTIDNGQHFLMGCYTNTLKYIDEIQSKEKFFFQDSLSISFQQIGGESIKLHSSEYFYPLNLLTSFIKFRLLTFSERLQVIKFLIHLNSIKKKLIVDSTVLELLKNNGQSNSTIEKFWEMLVVSAMNSSIQIASAKLFLEMIEIIFFSGKDSSKLVIPNVGLSEALIDPAGNYISKRGGQISKNEKVLRVNFDNESVASVITNKRTITDFDIVISSLTADKLTNLLDESICNKMNIPTLEYSPILSVNLWLKENNLKEKFYSLVGCKFHWLFNKQEYLSLLRSAAIEMINLDSEELIKLADSELRKYFPILNNIEIVGTKVIKERKATFVSDKMSIVSRNKLTKDFNNFYIAGDWTNTGLPSTIESAVKSGVLISEIVCRKYS